MTGAARLAARLAMAWGGLLVAGIAIGIATYVVSWRLLWGGLAGSDTLFHLQLVDWISGSFPALHWR